MKVLTLTYPDDLAQALEVSAEALPDHLRLMAALKLFELGKLSAGKAAELASISKVEFLETCGRAQISPFNYSDDEIEAELNADMQVGRKRKP